jgi:hypothetical protein
MMRSTALIILLAVAPAAEAAEVLKKVPSQLSADKAYVLLELRDVKALGSSAPSGLVLARYDPVGGDVRGGTRSPNSAVPVGQATRLTVTKNALVKAKESRLYFMALEPDTWVIEGASGTAFSLGSNSFVAEAGAVIDLGVLSPGQDWREGDGANKEFKRVLVGAMLFGAFAKKGDPTPFKADWRERGSGDLPVPVELTARIKPVQFAKGAKFGNYLGGLVNRIDGRAGRPGTQDADDGQLGVGGQPMAAVQPAAQDAEKSAPPAEATQPENGNAAGSQ